MRRPYDACDVGAGHVGPCSYRIAGTSYQDHRALERSNVLDFRCSRRAWALHSIQRLSRQFGNLSREGFGQLPAVLEF